MAIYVQRKGFMMYLSLMETGDLVPFLFKVLFRAESAYNQQIMSRADYVCLSVQSSLRPRVVFNKLFRKI